MAVRVGPARGFARSSCEVVVNGSVNETRRNDPTARDLVDAIRVLWPSHLMSSCTDVLTSCQGMSRLHSLAYAGAGGRFRPARGTGAVAANGEAHGSAS